MGPQPSPVRTARAGGRRSALVASATVVGLLVAVVAAGWEQSPAAPPGSPAASDPNRTAAALLPSSAPPSPTSTRPPTQPGLPEAGDIVAVPADALGAALRADRSRWVGRSVLVEGSVEERPAPGCDTGRRPCQLLWGLADIDEVLLTSGGVGVEATAGGHAVHAVTVRGAGLAYLGQVRPWSEGPVWPIQSASLAMGAPILAVRGWLLADRTVCAPRCRAASAITAAPIDPPRPGDGWAIDGGGSPVLVVQPDAASTVGASPADVPATSVEPDVYLLRRGPARSVTCTERECVGWRAVARLDVTLPVPSLVAATAVPDAELPADVLNGVLQAARVAAALEPTFAGRPLAPSRVARAADGVEVTSRLLDDGSTLVTHLPEAADAGPTVRLVATSGTVAPLSRWERDTALRILDEAGDFFGSGYTLRAEPWAEPCPRRPGFCVLLPMGPVEPTGPRVDVWVDIGRDDVDSVDRSRG
jgi:hypothetical protein